MRVLSSSRPSFAAWGGAPRRCAVEQSVDNRIQRRLVDRPGARGEIPGEIGGQPRPRLVLAVAEALQHGGPVLELATVHRLAARLLQLAALRVPAGLHPVERRRLGHCARYFNSYARLAACQSRSCSSGEASLTARPSAASASSM